MAKNWIKDAIKKPGSLTAAAKRAGKSISEYCESPPSTKAKQRCNLAKTLKSFKKEEGGSVAKYKTGGQTNQLQGCGCPYGMEMGPNKVL
tara:strand:+ start:1386 stop:1655 length:270 start_codon:yes stop_codon:yes gene_type:complete